MHQKALKGRDSENGLDANCRQRRDVESASIIDLQTLLRPFRAFSHAMADNLGRRCGALPLRSALG